MSQFTHSLTSRLFTVGAALQQHSNTGPYRAIRYIYLPSRRAFVDYERSLVSEGSSLVQTTNTNAFAPFPQ
jgi:hypothetical protein